MKKVNENSLWFRILHTPSLVVGAVLLILMVALLFLQPVLIAAPAQAAKMRSSFSNSLAGFPFPLANAHPSIL